MKSDEVCAFGESPQVQDQLVGEQLATHAVNEKLGRFGGGKVVVGYDASTRTWRLAKGAEVLTSAQGSVHVASLSTPPVGAQGAGTIESLRELGQVDASSELSACFQVRVVGAEMYERCWDGAHYYRLERARVQLAPTDCTLQPPASSADGT